MAIFAKYTLNMNHKNKNNIHLAFSTKKDFIEYLKSQLPITEVNEAINIFGSLKNIGENNESGSQCKTSN